MQDVTKEIYNHINFQDNLEKFSIGKTQLGQDILCLKKDGDNVKIVVFGAIHAREYVTSYLILEMLKKYEGKSSVYFVPLINVDGVLLVSNFKDKLIKPYLDELISINENSDDFSLWKANINAVDLNVNFDYKFSKGRKNILYKAKENYVGPYPFSEKETIAIREFLNYIKPDFVINYHAKGEEIYYGCDGVFEDKDMYLDFFKTTGYKLKTTPLSFGGVKEYFISHFNKPSITIEVGKDDVPYNLLIDNLNEIYVENIDVIDIARSIVLKL